MTRVSVTRFTTDTGSLPFRPVLVASRPQTETCRLLVVIRLRHLCLYTTLARRSHISPLCLTRLSSYFRSPAISASFDNGSQSSLLGMNLSHRMSMDNAADLNVPTLHRMGT